MSYYSVDKGDRGEVRLNDQIVQYAIRCNTNHGWVEKLVQPAQFENGVPVREVLHGVVTFVRHE